MVINSPRFSLFTSKHNNRWRESDGTRSFAGNRPTPAPYCCRRLSSMNRTESWEYYKSCPSSSSESAGAADCSARPLPPGPPPLWRRTFSSPPNRQSSLHHWSSTISAGWWHFPAWPRPANPPTPSSAPATTPPPPKWCPWPFSPWPWWRASPSVSTGGIDCADVSTGSASPACRFGSATPPRHGETAPPHCPSRRPSSSCSVSSKFRRRLERSSGGDGLVDEVRVVALPDVDDGRGRRGDGFFRHIGQGGVFIAERAAGTAGKLAQTALVAFRRVQIVGAESVEQGNEVFLVLQRWAPLNTERRTFLLSSF